MAAPNKRWQKKEKKADDLSFLQTKKIIYYLKILLQIVPAHPGKKEKASSVQIWSDEALWKIYESPSTW